MKAKADITERRNHTRKKIKNIVVGVLNTGEYGLIGSITDISEGGVRFTCQEFRKEIKRDPIHSIELRADNSKCMFDFSCSYMWDNKVKTALDSELTHLRQYGIQFGRLTSWQLAILRGIINDCSSRGDTRNHS
jgi:hypothetical protein